MLALMTNILQFAWWKCKAKKGLTGHWERYGPCYLLIIATLLVMVQPTCMLVIGSCKSRARFWHMCGRAIAFFFFHYRMKASDRNFASHLDPQCGFPFLVSDGTDDDTVPCNPTDDNPDMDPVNSHHGMTNFFFEVIYFTFLLLDCCHCSSGLGLYCDTSLKTFLFSIFQGDDTNFIVPNTTVGLLIQIFGTYLGFGFM